MSFKMMRPCFIYIGNVPPQYDLVQRVLIIPTRRMSDQRSDTSTAQYVLSEGWIKTDYDKL